MSSSSRTKTSKIKQKELKKYYKTTTFEEIIPAHETNLAENKGYHYCKGNPVRYGNGDDDDDDVDEMIDLDIDDIEDGTAINEDQSNKWLHELQNQLIDEFTDISLKEKEIMKKWNHHIFYYKKNVNNFVSNSALPSILKDFILQNSQLFNNSNEYRQLLGLLLVQFHENHLIGKQDIVDLLKLV